MVVAGDMDGRPLVTSLVVWAVASIHYLDRSLCRGSGFKIPIVFNSLVHEKELILNICVSY